MIPSTDTEHTVLPDRRILITGGVRSGKSRYAEALLSDSAEVSYVAAGPSPDPAADAEWAARITDHRARRPAHWNTMETSDVAGALRTAPGAILIDCLGTWLTAVVDRLGTWRARRGLALAVTNEVGWGLVSPYRSGRVFTELLGVVNQEMAAVSDEVIMIVAGRALQL